MFSDNDDMDENSGIPDAIRDMMGDANVIIALGLIMWLVHNAWVSRLCLNKS